MSSVLDASRKIAVQASEYDRVICLETLEDMQGYPLFSCNPNCVKLAESMT